MKSISFAQNDYKFSVGQQINLVPNILPENCTNKKLIYSSSNTNIATIDTNGIVTALNKGKAIITITNESKKISTKVNIEITNNFKIHFIKNIPGDSILIEDNGKFGLIDTGLSGNFKNTILPYLNNLNVKKLEFLILTHNDSDHVNAANNIIKKYLPTTVYTKSYHGNDLYSSSSQYDVSKLKSRIEKYNAIINDQKLVNGKITLIENLKEGHQIGRAHV